MQRDIWPNTFFAKFGLDLKDTIRWVQAIISDKDAQ